MNTGVPSDELSDKQLQKKIQEELQLVGNDEIVGRTLQMMKDRLSSDFSGNRATREEYIERRVLQDEIERRNLGGIIASKASEIQRPETLRDIITPSDYFRDVKQEGTLSR